MKIIHYLLIVLSFNAITYSQEVIDQSQINYNTYGSLAFDDLGQGFTTGTNGTITKIEVLMDCGSSFGCTGQHYNLKLFNANNDFTPNGNALFSSINPGFNGSNSVPVWESFVLSNGPVVAPGNKYVIVLTDNGSNSDFGFLQQTTNPYPNGHGMYRASNSTNAWNILSQQDFGFKIWVRNTLGINEEIFEKDSIKVYYDPFLNTLKIDSKIGFNASLYDLTGREIMNLDIIVGSNTFNTTTLQKGIYIFKSKESKIQFSKKINI